MRSVTHATALLLSPFFHHQLYLVVGLMGPCSFTLLSKRARAKRQRKEHLAGKGEEGMEEMMAGTIENQRRVTTGPIDTDPTSWKLYNNPHFSDRSHDSPQQDHPYNCLPPQASDLEPLLPLSDLFRSMDRDGTPSELDRAHAHIKELRAELELERRLRRKAESLNKALARELADERRAREASEGLCRRLAEEVASKQEEVDRTMKDVEEERRMLRIAEVWREERVQMKLNEARLVMEAKLREISPSPSPSPLPSPGRKPEMPKEGEEVSQPKVTFSCSDESNSGNAGSTSQAIQHALQRKEVENPHIRRGIKGFVEFPRSGRVRANGGVSFPSSSREGKAHLGSNLECQRAQLRILSRQRYPVGFVLMGTTENLVM